MATTPVAGERTTTRATSTESVKGGGWVPFAGLMLMIGGVLKRHLSIAAIGNSRFFVANRQFILSGLNTWAGSS